MIGRAVQHYEIVDEPGRPALPPGEDEGRREGQDHDQRGAPDRVYRAVQEARHEVSLQEHGPEIVHGEPAGQGEVHRHGLGPGLEGIDDDNRAREQEREGEGPREAGEDQALGDLARAHASTSLVLNDLMRKYDMSVMKRKSTVDSVVPIPKSPFENSLNTAVLTTPVA